MLGTGMVAFARFPRFAGFPPSALLRAGNLLSRSVEPAHGCAQGLDLAFVGRLLPLGFLQEFQQFIQRFAGLAQRGKDGFHFLDGRTNRGGGRRMSRRGRCRWRCRRSMLPVFAVFPVFPVRGGWLHGLHGSLGRSIHRLAAGFLRRRGEKGLAVLTFYSFLHLGLQGFNRARMRCIHV